MTRLFSFLRLVLAGLLYVTLLPRANADASTGLLNDAQPPPNHFLADTEVRAAGEAFSETGDWCAPVAYLPFPNSADCEATSGQSESFLLFQALVLPQPPDDELMVLNPAASAAPPQGPFSGWPLAGVATALVLIGGSGALRFRRTPTNRM